MLNMICCSGKTKGPETDACPTSLLSWKSENEDIVEIERWSYFSVHYHDILTVWPIANVYN